MTGFSTFGLSAAMLEKLNTLNFTVPTPIQEQAIPVAMEGKDILGTAQTGTGKTAAFGLPLVHHLMNNPHSTALIMTPTRELAVQVMTQVKAFLPDNSIKIALLIGGEQMSKQLTQLKLRPRLIVGTPGRINDHLDRKTLSLNKTDFLVLDEADRMLDMGFGIQIDAIAEYLPEVRQTLMFSATVPSNIMKLAKNYLKDPVRVETAAPHLAAPKIKQELIHVNDDGKHDELVKLIDARSGQIIVFVKTKHGADRLARRLFRENHSAEAIHGDLRQGQRDRVIRTFRKNEVRILVATDVAARGLDIPLLETVINYDLPQNPEDYIHRIGRTGRNGAEGEAICLISGADRSKWSAIDRLMNPGKARPAGERSEGSNSNRGPRKFGSGGGRGFGGGNSGGGRSFGGGAGRSFGGNSNSNGGGDKPSWKFDKAPARSEGRAEGGYQGRSERPSGDRPARSEGGYQGRSERPSGDRFERSERPARTEGSSNWSPEGKERAERLERPSGERFERPSSDRPARPAGEHNFTKKKTFGDKPREGGFREGGFRKDGPREGGFRPRPEGDRPARSEGDRPARPEGQRREGGFKPRTEGGFKPRTEGTGGYKKAGGFNQGGPRRPRTAA